MPIQRLPGKDDALRFIEHSSFLWFQRFQLVEDVYTPGTSDTAWLLAHSHLTKNLVGKSVLDIGTTNGAVAFEAERAGANRVLAVDIVDPDHFGFNEIRTFLHSKVEYLQASIYELPERVQERFDVVVFWGVLYHLRHPLLGLDCVAEMARSLVSIETAVADDLLRPVSDQSLTAFFRGDEFRQDATNWFLPTARCLSDWLVSAGLEPVKWEGVWPTEYPERVLVESRLVADGPEYQRLTHERLRVRPESQGEATRRTEG